MGRACAWAWLTPVLAGLLVVATRAAAIQVMPPDPGPTARTMCTDVVCKLWDDVPYSVNGEARKGLIVFKVSRGEKHRMWSISFGHPVFSNFQNSETNFINIYLNKNYEKQELVNLQEGHFKIFFQPKVVTIHAPNDFVLSLSETRSMDIVMPHHSINLDISGITMALIKMFWEACGRWGKRTGHDVISC